jgi:hypothetical protein
MPAVQGRQNCSQRMPQIFNERKMTVALTLLLSLGMERRNERI